MHLLISKKAKIAIMAVCLGTYAFICSACTPTVRVQVPDRPIEINLNVNMKIEQNVRVSMEKDLDAAAKANPGVF